MGKSQTPRRKRFTRPVRLMAAADWVKKYKGKHIISSYAKWFGVDKICAITELRILGILIPESLENQIKESIKTRTEQKRLIEVQKKDAAMDFNESDEYIGYIVGYTSGGAPYGLTHEEVRRINNDDLEYNVV
jgi:hypothetical protein